MDFLDKHQRSERMSRIRSRNTKPELVVRRELHRRGLRYRLHARSLPGQPDLVFPKYKTVIFVNGCFWHRHQGCKVASKPKSNIGFWEQKFQKNIERDRRKRLELEMLGWKVITVWECSLSSKDKASKIADELEKCIRGMEK